MPADAVAEVKSRLDIVDVVGAYVRLDRAGRSWKALCPFHSERTPSFNVSQEKQAWYCFGCQEGGDVINFVEKHEHLSFLQALELLAEKAGVELERSGADGRGAGRRRQRALELNGHAQAFYEHILWSTELGAPGRDLLEQRGVPEELARLFGIGFAPAGGLGGDAVVRWLVSRRHGTAEEAVAAGLAHPADRGGARDRFRNRLVFPIRDERGHVLGFGGRALGDAVPKYLNTPATEAYDKSRALFGLDLARPAITPAGAAVVVEGYFDVVAAHAAGVQHAVASSGTAMTTAQIRLIARFTKVIVLCFDRDDAGRAAASRAVDLVAAEGLEPRIAVLPPGFKDPDELVRRDPGAFALCVQEAPNAWRVLLDEAIDEAKVGLDDDRRAAADGVAGLLARIPDAATRELRLEQAALSLRLSRETLEESVRARGASSDPRRNRIIVAPPMVSEQTAGSDDGPPETIAQWEQLLGAVAVQEPALVASLVDAGLGLDDLVSSSIRRLLELGLECRNGEPFPYQALSPQGRSLAARLALRRVPALGEDVDPAAVIAALGMLLRRVREASLLRRLADLERQGKLARHEGRIQEADELAADVLRLSREYHALAGREPLQAR